MSSTKPSSGGPPNGEEGGTVIGNPSDAVVPATTTPVGSPWRRRPMSFPRSLFFSPRYVEKSIEQPVGTIFVTNASSSPWSVLPSTPAGGGVRKLRVGKSGDLVKPVTYA